MASKPTKNGKASAEEQVLRLKQWMETAHLNSYPKPTAEEEEQCPELIAWLAPEVIDDPDHRGSQKPRRVMREPMLMVTFDRSSGSYKFVITDKVCRTQVGGNFSSLLSFSNEIERLLREKKVWVKELEPTRRKEE
jgi:hypothetical protein